MKHQLSNAETEKKNIKRFRNYLQNHQLQPAGILLFFSCISREKKSIELNSKSIDFENIHMPAKQCA